MKRISAKGLVDLDLAGFQKLNSGFSKVWIDLGTGDGKFVTREASTAPDTPFIAIDADWARLAKPARAAERRKPPHNVIFVAARAEELPPELDGVADKVTINYPWGSLLKSLVTPELSVLIAIGRLCKPNTMVEIYVNYSVFATSEQVTALGLPELSKEYVESNLLSFFEKAGLKVVHCKFAIGPSVYRTTWGSKLTLGSKRETLEIKAIRV